MYQECFLNNQYQAAVSPEKALEKRYLSTVLHLQRCWMNNNAELLYCSQTMASRGGDRDDDAATEPFSSSEFLFDRTFSVWFSFNDKPAPSSYLHATFSVNKSN